MTISAANTIEIGDRTHLTSLMAKEGLLDIDQAMARLPEIVFAHWQERDIWEGASVDQVMLEKAQVKARRYGTLLCPPDEGAPVEDDLSPEARDYRKASRRGV